MSISYTNYLYSICEQLKAIIIAEFPRFGAKNRLLFKKLDIVDLSGEDVIFITPSLDNLEYEDTGGRTSTYIVELYYLRKIYPSDDYKLLTDVAEHIKALFYAENYRHNHDYWHYCAVTSIDYNLELPEENKNYYGFKVTLEIHNSQY